MDKLSFLDFSSTINGIVVDASFSKESIKEIYIPLLKHLSSMCSEKQARILVMLAAPPGAGKSTLVSFLEYLAKDAVPEKVTFDLERLREKISELMEGHPCRWPIYDRLLHNPVEDAITVDSDIVLLEGNYLLLDIDGWRDLSDYADFTISLSANEELLRKRLIARRVATGVNQEDAEKFVDFSDMANVRLCLENTKKADLELEITQDGTDIILKA